jgi:hypothetical protein
MSARETIENLWDRAIPVGPLLDAVEAEARAATPAGPAPATNRDTDVRDQVLHALDFAYCQSLGYSTPEELLAAYDTSRTVQAATDRDADVLVAEARRAVHESLLLLPAWEADRVRALIADLETAVEGRTAIRCASPAPAIDRNTLRDRIAALFRYPPGVERLGDATPGEIADAVLAVLPAFETALPSETSPKADSKAATERDGEELAKRIARAIWALKSPPPPGSQHYRSGWDDGLEAAIDAARDALEPAAVLPAPADRAAVLLEAADAVYAKGRPTCEPDGDCCWYDAVTELRRLAGEAQQDPTQDGEEARPSQHAWRVETRDPLANEWAPGSHFASRPLAVERYETANRIAPLWRDGTPVERRIVRETTTYTVEEPTTVARPGQPETD